MEEIKIKEEKHFLESKGLGDYKPFFPIFLEKKDYIIKTADTEEELLKTFALRYQVYGEFYKTKPPVPLDIDEYDKKADHIIVMQKSTQEVLGTYRVLCSDFTDNFYTAREFHLENLLNLDGRLVEMGRATVSASKRSGVVITLLWRGIASYILGMQADYLFGCATLWTQDVREVALANYLFKNQDLVFSESVEPYETNVLEGLGEAYEELLKDQGELDLAQIERSLPPLFKSYIKAGAKFSITPASDKKLQSVDFLSILKVSELSPALAKKYLSD